MNAADVCSPSPFNVNAASRGEIDHPAGIRNLRVPVPGSGEPLVTRATTR